MIETSIDRTYEFDGYRIDIGRRRLVRIEDLESIVLTPRCFDLLAYLVENPSRVITKDELLENVWENAFVEESNLSQSVFLLRKALGENTREPRYIATAPNRGYRFVAPVSTASHDLSEESPLKPSVDVPGPDDSTTKARFQYWLAPFLIGTLILTILAVWLLVGVRNQPIRSVAVLPFVDLSADQADRYLGIALADATVGKLGTIPELSVRSTRSTLAFAEAREDLSRIGRDLSVDAILDGRVQRVGDQIRVSAQLIRVADNTVIWSGNFDDRFVNLFSVQDNLSRRVADSVSVHFVERTVEKTATPNPAAYQEFLRGRYFWTRRSGENLLKAISHFENAISIDPGFARAYAGLAESYILLPEYGAGTPRDTFPKARAAIEQGLKLDGGIAELHSSLGYVQAFYDWNWDGAELSFRRSIELNPNSATAHQWFAEFLMSFKRVDECRNHLERARELDPLSAVVFAAFAGLADTLADSESEVSYAKQAVDLDPNFGYGHFYLGLGFERLGRDAEAAESLARSMQSFGEPAESITEVDAAFKTGGLRGWWEKRLWQIRTKPYLAAFPKYHTALVQIRLGDREGAIESLQSSLENRDHAIVYLNTEQRFAEILDDPKIVALLRKMNR